VDWAWWTGEKAEQRAAKVSEPDSMHFYVYSTACSISPERSQAEIDTFWRNYRKTQQTKSNNVPRDIHILGIGSIGKFVAHSLRGLPDPPPVTLLFHKKSYLDDWEAGNKEITINTDGISIARSGFNVEYYRAGFRRHGQQVTYEEYMSPRRDPHLQAKVSRSEGVTSPLYENASHEPIHNLIVCIKAADTVGALLNVRHRLKPDSSILFLQNGMGIIDEVNTKVFPDPMTRPNYMIGVISHGVNSQGLFSATHAGAGTIQIGLLPRSHPSRPPSPTPPTQGFEDKTWSPASRYILRTLARSPVLAAIGQTPTEIFQAQLEKLAVNAIINPITALLDSRNGTVLYNYSLTRAMRLLLAEISLVFRNLPELARLPNTETRFSAERLETLVVSVAYSTKDNVSSMCADVRAGRRTEIKFINGYVVKRGEEVGIKCVMNYLVMQLVKGKAAMVNRERNEEVLLSEPWDGSLEEDGN
jgi:2-dehydropantoate 2-reductase